MSASSRPTGSGVRTTSPQRQCSVEKCNRKYYAKMLCQMHYMRVRYHGDTNFQGQLKGTASPFYKQVGVTPHERF